MKEKIDASDIPASYLLCMKQDCPRDAACMPVVPCLCNNRFTPMKRLCQAYVTVVSCL